MISLLVTFAVKAEARPFERLIGTHPDLQVLLTHIGQRNAEKAICQELVERTPKMVLTCGFAGGLNPELTIGTVVFSVDANQLDTVSPPPTSPRQERSRPYGEFPSREGAGVGSAAQKFAIQPEVLSAALLVAGARPARFQCVEKVVTTAKAKRALREQTGADAVEMESGIIRAVCGRRNIPSATVRVISDAAHQDLPLDFNLLMDAEQNLSYARLALALAGSPRKISALLELQKQTQAAAENLARVLVTILASCPLKE